jgi:DNA polymerase III epsilon subunit-like protein
MKILWFDVETTGLNSVENDIISLAMIIEIDGIVMEELYLKIQPCNPDNISNEALTINGFKREEFSTFLPPKEAHKQIITFFNKYVDKYKKNKTINDKLIPAGYNVLFDVQFLSEFFKKVGDNYFGSFVDYHKLDVASIVLFLQMHNKIKIEGYKLINVANYLNASINAHDAQSDIRATREVAYKLLEKIEVKE